jgi:adenylate kinase family enzyme
MQRVAILGCSGGGKSTLARGLGAKLGLPVVHLDALFWQPGWTEPDMADFVARVTEAAARERWVMDGGYSATLPIRLPRADTIVVIDQPRWLCLWRVVWRWLTHIGRTREDMGADCPEKVDWEFVHFIWTYPTEVWPKHAEAIARHGGQAQLVRLTSDREIAAFLERAT